MPGGPETGPGTASRHPAGSAGHRTGGFDEDLDASRRAGGLGLNTSDTLTALENWVERGVAPATLVASHTSLGFPDNVMTASPPPGDFSRLLCPYPQVARWTGRGSETDAANFVCELRGRDRAAAARDR